MSTALLERTVAFASIGTVGPSLDEVLGQAWEGLIARHAVPCVVCGGSMHPVAGQTAGRCQDCGTTLA